ncbi:MAG: DNA polymerase III subunit gamma/tau [Flavobacteriales bacterium]|jgi:DNA polymerase-3 subunit gamma/tau|nr:DNA polymerase III subunit gamma/tau [Flavobacteriales bacterium]
MKDYIVAARKYRPHSFDTVVGQSSIKETLKSAILNNHLGQAFLFCGPRGVGKTSSARILAKTINCLEKDDRAEPCEKCESCTAFNEQHSFNIHELDAASNNSVDDIRSLVDQVRIPPQVGNKSVYIIDEVHMLSQSAFNAFLKTLEEPPKHAIFILATTEKHKILPTILSRCQVFDFNRIEIKDIQKQLHFIADQEGVKLESEASLLIAKKADGAMRDALSIFDKMASFTQDISYQITAEHLNVLDYDYYFQIVEDILDSNIPKVLLTFNEILHKGFDPHIFITGLAEHLRDLLVCKDEATVKLLEVGEKAQKQYLEQSKKANITFIIQGLDICNQCDVQYRTSKNKRMLVELALMQLSSLESIKKKSPLG